MAASFAHFALAGSFAYCTVNVLFTSVPAPDFCARVRKVSVADTELV